MLKPLGHHISTGFPNQGGLKITYFLTFDIRYYELVVSVGIGSLKAVTLALFPRYFTYIILARAVALAMRTAETI